MIFLCLIFQDKHKALSAMKASLLQAKADSEA